MSELSLIKLYCIITSYLTTVLQNIYRLECFDSVNIHPNNNNTVLTSVNQTMPKGEMSVARQN